MVSSNVSQDAGRRCIVRGSAHHRMRGPASGNSQPALHTGTQVTEVSEPVVLQKRG
jgi:hypothetical protein